MTSSSKRTVRLIEGLVISMVLIAPSLNSLGMLVPNTKTLSDDNIMCALTFQEPGFQKRTIKDSTYTELSLPGSFSIGDQPGTPTYQVTSLKLLLPQGTTAATITVNVDTVELDVNKIGINLKKTPLIPLQPSVPIGDPAPPFVFDTKAYHSHDLVPNRLYDSCGIGYSHGYAILTVNLYPLQYIPAEGRLFLHKNMKITVTLKKTEEINRFYRPGNLDDQTWVTSLVANPEIIDTYGGGITPKDYPGGLCDPSDNNGQGYDYVIIVRAALYEFPGSPNWNDLIQRKEAQGLHATKVRVEDILACPDYRNTDPVFDDTPARIREFCRDAYQDWGTQYVLVAGDTDGFHPLTKLEKRLMVSNDGAGGDETDLYWSNLDNTFNADHDSSWGEIDDAGFDPYSELFFGTIPCDEPQDISIWLTKSFYYADNTDHDYLDSAAFFAGCLGWFIQGDDFIDFSAIKGTYKWFIQGHQEGPQGPYPEWLGYQYGFDTWNHENPGLEYDTSVRWTTETPNPGWNPGPSTNAVEQFRQEINQNRCTLISAVAHADPHMSMSVYDTLENAHIEDPGYNGPYWAYDYQNTKPFFLHDYGCHCADMNAVDDGVLETMLFSKYLAFACVYNTGYGWGNWYSTNSSSAVLQKTFWDYLFDIAHHSGSFTNWQLGKAHAWSKDTLAPTLHWTSDTWRLTIECCLLFGDPAQLLKPPGNTYGPAHGTVRYINLEGGFYGIIADNGRHFDPLNLPEMYRVDGLRCEFSGHIVDRHDTHMWGMDIDLTVFEPRDTIINQQAIVRYNSLEGGFYYLDLVGSPVNLLPLNLPATYQTNGLRVTVSGYQVNVANPMMFGQPFQITRITSLGNNHIHDE
jgi:hypothetical protein